jgi:hypothetical protein
MEKFVTSMHIRKRVHWPSLTNGSGIQVRCAVRTRRKHRIKVRGSPAKRRLLEDLYATHQQGEFESITECASRMFDDSKLQKTADVIYQLCTNVSLLGQIQLGAMNG